MKSVMRALNMLRRNVHVLICISMAILFIALPLQSHGQKIPSKTAKTEQLPTSLTAEVRFEGKTLFEVKERVLSFSPEDRARLIAERIDTISTDPLLRIGDIKAIETDEGSAISYRDRIIMTVTDKDARSAGQPRSVLAQEYIKIIQTAINEKQARYSFKSMILGIVYALLSIAIIIAILFIFKKIFPKFYHTVSSWKDVRIHSIRVQQLEVLSAERIISVIISSIRGIRAVLTIILFYFYIPILFSFFPWTHGLAGTLFDYILSPFKAVGKAILGYLPNLFFLAVIGVVTHYANKLIHFIFGELEKGTLSLPGFYQEWAMPTYKIVRFLVFMVALVMAFPYLPGSESEAFKGVSIFLGVLFSLGSTSAVANVVAGLILNYTRAFSIGDRVRIGDVEGDIIFKTLLVTHIRTIKNVEITLPNSSVIGGSIHNFSTAAKESALILHTSVTIGYDAPWRRVHELLIAAARATNLILENPPPFVLQTALNDFYVSYQINAYTDHPHEMAIIYSELHQNIQDKFNEGGVEIMSPHYSQLRDGNTTTIPESYRPADYAPTGLRITQTEDTRQNRT
jgi:small-conductance mechanosensitive channel